MIEDVDCHARLTISGRQLCSGIVAGVVNSSSCFPIVPSGGGYALSTSDDLLSEFSCIGDDPCANLNEEAYCVYQTVETYNPPAAAEGQCREGDPPEAVCVEAAAAAAGGTVVDSELLSVLVADAEELGRSDCSSNWGITQGTDCTEGDFDAEIEDTGVDAVTPDGVAETYQAEMILMVDPGASTISITGTDNLTDTVNPSGFLLALTGPNRFAVGIIHGGPMTMEGDTWHATSASFDAPMYPSTTGSAFTLGSGQLDEIVWSGREGNLTERDAFGVAPSQPASGEIDVGNGTWEVSFTQTVAGRLIEVELAGSVDVP